MLKFLNGLSRAAIAGCCGLAMLLGLGGAAGAQPAQQSATGAVEIRNFSFAPKELTVARGATVTWSNRDSEPHTVVSSADPKVFKSPPLDTGDTFSFVFNAPGTYAYYCSVHPHMQGTIVVK
jgi:plastocyanin